MKTFHKATCTTLCIIGAVALTSLPIAVHANPGKSDAGFSKMDANKDGMVSAAEHAAGARQMFDTMDANKDGRVTAAEMDAAHQRVTGAKATKGELTSAEKIKVIDKDGDGVLTAEEHAAGSQSMFQKMDTNKDGFLTKVELATGHASMLKKA